jgi:hypothetical protein
MRGEPMAGFHSILDTIYLLSQISLPILGIAAAFAAYSQVNTFRLFELLKYTQDPAFRAARRTVIREIAPVKDTEWWTNELLEREASSCAAHYDVLGRTLVYAGSRRLAAFFISQWADSILRTYVTLNNFLANRREAGGNDYSGYEWLYQRARKHKQSLGHNWPEQARK